MIDWSEGRAPNRATVTLGGLARYVAPLLVVLMCVRAVPARAGDNVTELSKLLASSSNEKTRLAAVVALAKLGDKRALKPLVTALADPSPKIRAVAAVGLGRLGHKAALPSLKNAANDDADDEVRSRAKDAAIAVARTNQLPNPFASEGTVANTAPAPKRARAGFGTQPHALESRPDLYIVIKASNDDSPGTADKATRKSNAEIIKNALASQCRNAPNVTSVSSEADHYGLPIRVIDLSIVKMEVNTVGSQVVVSAQLRVAVSDGQGKMLSFLSNAAELPVSKSSFHPRLLPGLRKQLLETAMNGMFDKLVAHLRDQLRS
jgi:hypothetical protein